MTFWLDHLAAVLVAIILTVALFLVQQRGRQHAVQATVTHTVQTRTYDFVRTFERDVENMRTEGQARAATGTYTCAATESGSVTTAFTFPTLLRPDLGPGSPVGHVTYRLESTGRTVRAGGAERALFRLIREQDNGTTTTTTGGSGETIVGFDVALFARGASAPALVCPDNLGRVRLELLAAAEGPLRLTGEQAATGTHGLTRHGFTFTPLNR